MDNLKALLAKAWKDEDLELEPSRHFFDEVVMVRVVGTIDKLADQMIAPTASIPLITVIALFWQRCGVRRRTPAIVVLRTTRVQLLQMPQLARFLADKAIRWANSGRPAESSTGSDLRSEQPVEQKQAADQEQRA